MECLARVVISLLGMTPRLYRSNEERKLLGVCGGIAQRFDIDPTIVRLAFILFTFGGGSGLLLYLLLAIVIPRAPMLPPGQDVRVLPGGIVDTSARPADSRDRSREPMDYGY